MSQQPEQSPNGETRGVGRLDAQIKARGRLEYVADLLPPGTLHAAVVRSTAAHARIAAIDTEGAKALPGIVGVYTAADVSPGTYGRMLRDVPILARDKVRFIGEPVAAVVAATRQLAEKGAALVYVTYEHLQAITTIADAIAPDAPRIHEAPWSYPGAAVGEGDGVNLVYHSVHGDLEAVGAALANSEYVVDRVYETQSVHQGYLEPQACIASWDERGRLQLWITNKSPYMLRRQLANCLGIPESVIDVRPTPIGGDFGGKGSPEQAPLCAELARLCGRPVKLVLRYSEDLTATNPRHPASMRVRVGADLEGRLTALSVDAKFNSGAYGGFTPYANGPHGAAELDAYDVPLRAFEVTRVYTNTVPRGNMRAPGAPQGNFAVESALDELARVANIDPIDLRRKNLVPAELGGTHEHPWAEYRGRETLDAAVDAYRERPVPTGWLHGRGVSIYARPTRPYGSTSLRLVPLAGHRIRVELPFTETGTGSHTVAREMVADACGVPPADVDVIQVGTDDLPHDGGAGGSRVTASLSNSVDEAAKAWRNRLRDDEPVTVTFDNEEHRFEVGSYCVHLAQVAIDPETGETRVLEILTAVDVAAIVNPKAHQMQIDGAVAMGFGFGRLEDLDEADGQVWAANLGDFKIPSARDVPTLRTVLVPGAIGVGSANVKNIGETGNPGVGAAIANAVADATGRRIRRLPLSSQRVFEALRASQE